MYVHASEERLLQAARGDRVDGLDAASVLKKAKKEKRLQDWEEKYLHGQYLRQTREGRCKQIGLASEWRFEEGDRKSDSYSIE